MQGRKIFQPKLYYGFSLEQVVPQDDFYRKLEKSVDFSWIRPKVAHRYSDIGRPSIDPEVLIKIELVGYIEGIFSERRLMREIHDRLSLRRYVGYDIDEEVPDHSTLSKARDLLGKELFQAIFDHSVRLCQSAGMIGGVHVSGDRTIVKANASMDSLEARIVHQTPQEFVNRVFAENPVPSSECEQPTPIVSLTDQPGYPIQLALQRPPSDSSVSESSESVPEMLPSTEPETDPELKPDADDGVEESNGTGDGIVLDVDVVETGQEIIGTEKKGKSSPTNTTHISRTDPDATIVSRPGKPSMLAYSAEFWTDSRAGVITYADAVTGKVPEEDTVIAAIHRQRQDFGLPTASVSLDKGYGLGRLYRQLKVANVIGFVPHQRFVSSTSHTRLYSQKDFKYDVEREIHLCPGAKELKYSRLHIRWPSATHVWKANVRDCESCELRAKCTKAKGGRTLGISIYQAYYDEMDKRLAGLGARLAAIARRVGPEPRFGEAKQWQGFGRAKYRGLEKFRGQALMTAAAQNIKKYVKLIWRAGQGAASMRPTATIDSGLVAAYQSLPPAISLSC